MTYWIYENWVAESKAVIHAGSCRFCNEGAGTGRNVLGERNGKWHGAFRSFSEASAAAGAIGRPVRSCRCIGAAVELDIPVPAKVLQPKPSLKPKPTSPVASPGLPALGFVRAGTWRLDPRAKSGVRFQLDALRTERVIYCFVVEDVVSYIGICDSAGTTLADRMSRYQNVVGAGTNERVVALIRGALSDGRCVEIWALVPPKGPSHLDLPVDYVKGLEFSLINRLNPAWNRRR